MVRYLNNRRRKSRGNSGQNDADQSTGNNSPQQGNPQQGNQQQGSQRQGNQQQEQGNQSIFNAQGVPVQDQPGTVLVSRAWQMIKRLCTYQPSETDDTFSLGGRRVAGNPKPNQQGNNPTGSGGLQQGNAEAGQRQDQTAVNQNGQQGTDSGGRGKRRSYQTSIGRQGYNSQGQNNNTGWNVQGQSKVQGQYHGQKNSQHQGLGQNQSQSNSQDQDQNQGQEQSQEQSQGQGQGQAQAQVQPPPNSAPYFQEQDLSQEVNFRHTQQGGMPPGEDPVPVELQVHYDIDKNLEHVERTFNIPDNKGFTIREFLVGFEPPRRAFVLFTEGLADKNIINKQILDPLMVLTGIKIYQPANPIALVKERLVSANQVEEKYSFKDVIEGVLVGSTALFIEGSHAALLVETKGWEHRGIGRPQVENVVRGPQEGFNELLISNIALVRSRLRTENLVSEMFKVGKLSQADVAVMYLNNVANPAIVEEVRRRLGFLMEVDYIPDTGILEQFIEDSPYSPMPQILSTERPDRVAAYLAEGHVAILMSSTPFALIVPVTFWALLHSAEDSYVRWPYGGLMRIVRVTAMLIAMLAPAFYIAIVNYHDTMLPTDLLFAIAASRERIPFPAIMEVILMELSFELIREAGIRIPSVIGSTIGIVGALILGQAAVQANLITPLVIIIVALTGLSSFAIPNYNLSFQVRIIRFIYLVFAAIGGFYAISMLMVMHMAVLSSNKSFGVPILSPAAPNRPSKDTVMRAPLWSQENRPNLVRPLVESRQAPVSRGWSPKAKKERGEQN